MDTNKFVLSLWAGFPHQHSHYRQPTGVLQSMSITNRCFLVCVSILLGITVIHILLGICPFKRKK